jgi:hypothetical protein
MLEEFNAPSPKERIASGKTCFKVTFWDLTNLK